jgi:O-antigen ligase
MGLYMTHSLKEFLGGRHMYRMSIVRMVGVDNSLGDPNSFGASIVFALPFVTTIWNTTRSKFMRFCAINYVCLSCGCIMLTGSRSSFIGMLVWWAILLWRSKHRWAGFALAFVSAPVIFLALPESLQNRFETIINPDVGPENAKQSGEGRLEGLQTGFILWGRYPLTGIGPGVWRPATGSPIESHNLYGQLVGEMGTIGLVAFVGILLCFWSNLRWMKRYRQRHPERANEFAFCLCDSIAISLFMLLLMGNFGHNLFRHNWLWYGGYLIIARHCVESRRIPQTASVYFARIPANPFAQSARYAGLR